MFVARRSHEPATSLQLAAIDCSVCLTASAPPLVYADVQEGGRARIFAATGCSTG